MILEGQSAIITGAGSGMGEATSYLLSREGASVLVADADGARSKEVAERINSLGGNAAQFQVDVSDEEQVRRMADTGLGHFSTIDILVNCAAISEFRPTVEITGDKWRRMIDVDLSGTFFCCREVGKKMIKAGRGRIINFASTAGIAGIPSMAHYCAAKHGVVGLTKAIATEWGKHGITANCICPGATLTPMLLSSTTETYREERARRIPLKRLATTEEQASIVLFLCSPAAQYLTGNLICTDGGISALAASTSTTSLNGQS
jgi:NAD(P)-dependent dehydrogenase (short-subunit alcohol dehydrogenase family)